MGEAWPFWSSGGDELGQSSAVLRLRDDLRGVIFCRRPDPHDVELVLGALAEGLLHNRPACTSLIVDMRRLESVDLRTFDKLLSQLLALWNSFGRFITRQAVLHGGGLVAAIAAAFCAVADPQFPGKAFAEPLEAIAWLGLSDRAVLDDLDRASRETSSNESLLSAVRVHLRSNPASGMADLVEALGVSPRTLQRRLRELHTTFQQEAGDARLRTAKVLMTETDHPLKHIAIDCGFASLQHFSAFFRDRVGTPPGRWRALYGRDVPTCAPPVESGALRQPNGAES